MRMDNSLTLTNKDWDNQVQSFNQANRVVKELLQPNIDYGIIPGTTANTLFKPGAEKLVRFFQIHIEYDIDKCELENGHVEYIVDAVVKTNSNQNIIGEGTGSCSTMESKYRYRKAGRVCPICGKESIIKGKREYGGGWLCYAKKDGCGAKFADGDKEIENQEEGYKEHDNPADYRNTCRKMAKKRAYVDAVITVLGIEMSQDLETVLENMFHYTQAKGDKGTEDFKEIKDALEEAKISKTDFSKWLQISYGKDVETISILKTEKEKILETIKNSPSEISLKG